MFPESGNKMKTGGRERQTDRVFMATITNSWFRVKLCSFLRRGYSSSPSAAPRCSLQPPDVNLLAESARISLTPKEVEDFAPKIRQVIDWFGQLQAVDLESIEPALRADTEVDGNSRLDSPEIFENREAILAGIPCYEEPYIKVPKVINKE